MPNKTPGPAFLQGKQSADERPAPAPAPLAQETRAAFDRTGNSDAPEVLPLNCNVRIAVCAASPRDLGQPAEVLRDEKAAKAFPPLDHETRAGVETDCAAFHLNREPQTLRVWACKESGPIRPRRINGRLMWPTAELRKLCGVAI